MKNIFVIRDRPFQTFLSLYAILLLLITSTVQAGTVSGLITTDTTWDAAGSPYIIENRVQVAYGVTLRIDPGVEIQGGSIETFGTLEAFGGTGNPVVFDGVTVAYGANIPSEPALIQISYAEFNSGAVNPPTGNFVYGTLILRDSILQDTKFIYLWYPVDDSYIEHNMFINAGGISVGTSDEVQVYIRNNYFYGQTSGYAVENWASYGTSMTVVEGNSFVSTDRVAVQLPPGYDNAAMTAYNNYWGTVDEVLIGQMIYDKNDDLSASGYIPYTPYLTDHDISTPIPADMAAPIITSGPTITAITDSTATITWQTDEPASSSASYGVSDLLDNSASAPGYTSNHSVVLSGLNPGTQYSVKVNSTDEASNGPTYSNVITFTTVKAPDMADTTPPVFTVVPVNKTVETTGLLTYVWLGNVSARDDISPVVTINNNAPGSGFPLGVTIVTWTATDMAGNIATATQVITVKDATTYSWYTGSWGACTGLCGTNNGTKSRAVYCKSSTGAQAPDYSCLGPKPATSERCTASMCSIIPANPGVSLSINGLNVTLNWNPVNGASGYKLYYAPYPYTGPESIGFIDVGNTHDFSIELWEGAAFYVAVSAYNATGESGYSNINQFTVSK